MGGNMWYNNDNNIRIISGGVKMRIYLNPGNDLFRQAVNSRIYVDKSMLIEATNSLLDTSDGYEF